MYASLDRSDADHRVCRELIESADESLVIPEPVLAEVDYWIHAKLHAGVLVALLDDIVSGAYVVEPLAASDFSRIMEICDRYADADVLAATDQPGLADQLLPGLGQRQRLDRRHPGEALQPQHQLELRGQGLAVHHDRAPQQGTLLLRREVHQRAEDGGLEAEPDIRHRRNICHPLFTLQ